MPIDEPPRWRERRALLLLRRVIFSCNLRRVRVQFVRLPDQAVIATEVAAAASLLAESPLARDARLRGGLFDLDEQRRERLRPDLLLGVRLFDVDQR